MILCNVIRNTSPSSNFEFKVIWNNWISTLLNCNAFIFDRIHLFSEFCELLVRSILMNTHGKSIFQAPPNAEQNRNNVAPELPRKIVSSARSLPPPPPASSSVILSFRVGISSLNFILFCPQFCCNLSTVGSNYSESKILTTNCLYHQKFSKNV